MNAVRALLWRLVYTVPVVWLVVSIVFLLIHLVPGRPRSSRCWGEGARPADITALRHAYGLDLPLGTQYAHYWRGVLHGDLGHSLPVKRLRHPPGAGALSLYHRADRGGAGAGAAAGHSRRGWPPRWNAAAGRIRYSDS